MDSGRKQAIIDEILAYDGVPLRQPGDFTLEEYLQRHKEKYGYVLPESTARDRLARHVREGALDTSVRYDMEFGERKVWYRGGGERNV